MQEMYTISVETGRIAFAPRDGKIPEYISSGSFNPADAPKGLSIVCRMGAPDLAHCIIFRHEDRSGGIFAMHEQGTLLFVAIAESNLAYSMAKSFFGELTANARYGVDIYESTVDGND